MFQRKKKHIFTIPITGVGSGVHSVTDRKQLNQTEDIEKEIYPRKPCNIATLC